ncbi:hypothetical protein CY34DRAFT_184511 [Suillus luteus UH-Slu-Lm8-n1]|uniref:Uncharacterized protein n=1 Tax=Suillus luteus UH-Slu-Lm8-n1 TaxID=930992 RepID=A0A0D0ACV7_9AGAM|nr:hypothetical protein CY34DRAFT_184511 [Suillus luteus UH-Slu-Lm8-n1]
MNAPAKNECSGVVFQASLKLKWRREAQPRIAEKSTAANGKGKRRLTLDEELARARSSDQLVELGLESGELFGTGTGSKRRGCLAGGGAGGAPVFMGAGYVRGVEGDGLSLPVSRIYTAAERLACFIVFIVIFILFLH